MSNWRRREERREQQRAEDEKREQEREQERSEAIASHEATMHIDEMKKLLRCFGDLSDQDFVNKAFAEALEYLLNRAREEDLPR